MELKDFQQQAMERVKQYLSLVHNLPLSRLRGGVKLAVDFFGKFASLNLLI